MIITLQVLKKQGVKSITFDAKEIILVVEHADDTCTVFIDLWENGMMCFRVAETREEIASYLAEVERNE